MWLTDWQRLTTSEDGRIFPVVPVQGNHENGDLANLVHIFNAPFQGRDSANVFYSLDVGGDFFHMLALNSEVHTGGEQRNWLERDLIDHAQSTFKGTFAIVKNLALMYNSIVL